MLLVTVGLGHNSVSCKQVRQERFLWQVWSISGTESR